MTRAAAAVAARTPLGSAVGTVFLACLGLPCLGARALRRTADRVDRAKGAHVRISPLSAWRASIRLLPVRRSTSVSPWINFSQLSI